MVVTNMRCENCGYEWRPRGNPRRCPSCLSVLGETMARKRRRSEKKLGEQLVARGWHLEPSAARRTIDVQAEKEGRKLFIDVKSGRSYHIRRSQLEDLIKNRGEKSEVGFALEMDGRFYLFTLSDVI